MTELTNNVIYQILCTMVKLLGLLPRGVGLSVGKGLGLTAYVLDRRHRRIALRNLAMAMPGVPGKARFQDSPIIRVRRKRGEAYYV
jgi:lauroyl/myristoyl acyltransferase